MGMDVYGLKPTTERGEYFRNNVWFWHPLWDYCIHLWPELQFKVPEGHYNSGDGLNAADSRKLGFMLENAIKSGSAQIYVDEYYKYISQLEQEPCYCTVTGAHKLKIFTDESTTQNLDAVAQLNSIINQIFGGSDFLTSKVSDQDPNPDCKICFGSGKTDNPASSYQINLKNIQSFSFFLLECGGFRIC